MAPSSALPIGADRVVSEIQPAKVDPSSPGSGLLHAVLGLLAPFPSDESERYDEEILDLNIIGFIIMCVLLPCLVLEFCALSRPAVEPTLTWQTAR